MPDIDSDSVLRFLRPPLLLGTKTHSRPVALQLEHVLYDVVFELGLFGYEISNSPSHLIFFSLQERHAFLATERFSVPQDDADDFSNDVLPLVSDMIAEDEGGMRAVRRDDVVGCS